MTTAPSGAHRATPAGSLSGAASPSPAAARGRRVVDAPTRMFHWLFALSFAGAYITADGERWRHLHVALGYTLAGLLAFRVLYGLFGPRQARLGVLWRKLAGTGPWLRSVADAVRGGSLQGINGRQGQNLLMALGVAALLALALPLTLSGYGTYNEWGGGDLLEELHELLGDAMLAVVLAHLGLVAGLSLLRRTNQALPMLTGRVQGTGPDLVKRNHAWLAGLLLVAVVAFVGWELQSAPGGAEGSAKAGPPWSERAQDDDD